jgi:hypothetical protein
MPIFAVSAGDDDRVVGHLDLAFHSVRQLKYFAVNSCESQLRWNKKDLAWRLRTNRRAGEQDDRNSDVRERVGPMHDTHPAMATGWIDQEFERIESMQDWPE